MSSDKIYDIDSLLEDVVTLPSMPVALARLNQLLDDPECSLREVAKAISSDPAIALKTLRLVNSAYYGLGQEVSTVEHAVALLGIKVIKNLTLTATVFDSMKSSAELFLLHCVGCGTVMKVMAEHGFFDTMALETDEAFVFGLLHDIGKVILEEYLPEECEEVVALQQTDGIPWYQAEREIIGVDHAELGARLAEQWKLPPAVVHAIGAHHDIETCTQPEYSALASALGIADYICSAGGLPSHHQPVFDLQDEVWRLAEVDNTCIPKLLNDFFDAYASVHELLKIAV